MYHGPLELGSVGHRRPDWDALAAMGECDLVKGLDTFAFRVGNVDIPCAVRYVSDYARDRGSVIYVLIEVEVQSIRFKIFRYLRTCGIIGPVYGVPRKYAYW